MAVPRREAMSVRIITLYSLFLQLKNSYSKDFLMYDHDPRGLLVFLVLRILIVLDIRRCVNITAATMKTARSVEEDRCEVNVCGVQS